MAKPVGTNKRTHFDAAVERMYGLKNATELLREMGPEKFNKMLRQRGYTPGPVGKSMTKAVDILEKLQGNIDDARKRIRDIESTIEDEQAVKDIVADLEKRVAAIRDTLKQKKSVGVDPFWGDMNVPVSSSGYDPAYGPLNVPKSADSGEIDTFWGDMNVPKKNVNYDPAYGPLMVPRKGE